MDRGEKLAAFGTVCSGLAGSFAVAYLIYSLQENKSFWTNLGIGSVVILGSSLLILILGLAMSVDSEGVLNQTGGKNSTNFQAAGNITIGSRDCGSN